MVLTLITLLACALFIYLACEYFVNGVEWLGYQLGIQRSAVGTVLAAFGTALPESVVTFVAVVLGRSPDQSQIGIGAAMGGPLVLASIGYGAVGLGWLYYQRGTLASWVTSPIQARLAREQRWFLFAFAIKAGLGLIVFSLKPWAGVLLLLLYGIYAYDQMRNPSSLGEENDELEPLMLRPKESSPSIAWSLLQTGLALLVTFIASYGFVGQLTTLGPALGLSPQLTALLLSPVATELPEILNAIIWLSKGKVLLALGNVAGSMMIQATVPSALGLMFTPWIFDRSLLISALVTLVASAWFWILVQRHLLTPARLASFGLFYFVFAGAVWAWAG